MPQVNLAEPRGSSGHQSICHLFSRPGSAWKGTQWHHIGTILTAHGCTESSQMTDENLTAILQIFHFTIELINQHPAHLAKQNTVRAPVCSSNRGVAELAAAEERSLQRVIRWFRTRELYTRQLQALTQTQAEARTWHGDPW